MANRYKYLTIWVTKTCSIFDTSVSDHVDFFAKEVPWSELKRGDFYRNMLSFLGNDGWQIVSTSVPDKNGITCFILSKTI